MNILPTAYAPRQGESLGKHSLQKIDAIPEEVRSAIDDGLNDIRFNGYRWECNAKTGWARVSPISSPADAEPESPEQSQANARADFLALQGEYLSVTQETKSEKKSATDTDQTGNSSKAAYSQVQTVPSHDAQQAEVTTQASLSPPPTTANHPDSAKFERSATLNAINTHKRYTCLPENFTASQRVLDTLKSMRFH
ncbi:TPA: hypothetical protein ACG32K_003518 [Escherichia coli]